MFRIGLVLSLALAPVLLSSGCILGCSGYTGGSNQVFQNGTQQLILCPQFPEYVALTNGQQAVAGWDFSYADGSPEDSPAEIVFKTGPREAEQTAFTLYVSEAGVVTVPGLAAGDWQELHADAAELDHYTSYCKQAVAASGGG